MKLMTTLIVLLLGTMAHASAAETESAANTTVEASGHYEGWGSNRFEAYRDACSQAQAQCQNRSVKRITAWNEWDHHIEGYFNIVETATFACLPENATEENLNECSTQ